MHRREKRICGTQVRWYPPLFTPQQPMSNAHNTRHSRGFSPTAWQGPECTATFGHTPVNQNRYIRNHGKQAKTCPGKNRLTLLVLSQSIHVSIPVYILTSFSNQKPATSSASGLFCTATKWNPPKARFASSKFWARQNNHADQAEERRFGRQRAQQGKSS